MAGPPKKYGLILPARPAPVRPVRPPLAPAARPALAAFQGGDDDDDDELDEDAGKPYNDRQAVNRRLQQEAERNMRLKHVEAMHAQALAEDPTIFDYDTAHDLIKEQAAAQGPAAAFTGGSSASKAKEPAKPKYIGALMEMAAERKRDQERVMIRKLQREREKEGDEFKDKEQFVTAAYKEKLLEQRRQEELERLKEAQEDVRKKGDLTGFYRNLLGVAPMGAVAAAAGPAAPVPPTKVPTTPAVRPPAAAGAPRPSPPPAAGPPPSASALSPKSALAGATPSPPPPPAAAAGHERESPAPELPEAKRARTSVEPKPAEDAAAKAQEEALKRMSARERYLARKQAQQQQQDGAGADAA